MRDLLRFFVASGLCLAAAGSFAQEIATPASTVPHTRNGAPAMHTNYLAYTGVWNHRSADEALPLMALHGPRVTGVQGYHPSDIITAYGLAADAGSQAIAIIDAYDLPTKLNDFNVFSSEFGLPTETSTSVTASTNKVFQVVYPQGSQPAANGSWGGEIALDIEWAHAVAPAAKIYLIECASDSPVDLFNGVRYVAQNLPNVREVSMSFGTNEFSTEQQEFDSYFSGTNQSYFSAVGDTSNETTYPSVSPYVVGVGGTSLNLVGGNVQSETAWNSSGGGVSQYVTIPSFQSSVASIVGLHRGTPDMSADGDPDTGCAVYDSTPQQGIGTGWLIFGGTSLSCPICAAITNARGAFSAGGVNELNRIYGQLAGTTYFRDILSGSSGSHSAGPGYDLVTGWGDPIHAFAQHGFSLGTGRILAGIPLSGVPANMTIRDNKDYVVRSTTVGTIQEAAVAGTLSGSIATGATVFGGTFAITGASSGLCELLVYNPSTKQYGSVGTVNLTTTSGTTYVNVPNIAGFISSGTVQVELTSVGTGSVILEVDQIALTAATK